MGRFVLFLCVFFTAVASISTANALTFTVGDNIADNLYLASGTTINGSFDINPQLLPKELYNAPYDIQSGHYVFSFVDDNDLNYERTYSTNWSGSYLPWANNTFTRMEYKVYSDSAENVTLEISENQYYGGTNHYNTTVYNSTAYNYNFHKYWTWWLTDTYITYSYDETDGYKGQFTITNVLNDADILALSQGGILDFTVTANGDLIYSSGILTVDVNSNPVPEPATLMLLGAGLLGACGFRKKRK